MAFAEESKENKPTDEKSESASTNIDPIIKKARDSKEIMDLHSNFKKKYYNLLSYRSNNIRFRISSSSFSEYENATSHLVQKEQDINAFIAQPYDSHGKLDANKTVPLSNSFKAQQRCSESYIASHKNARTDKGKKVLEKVKLVDVSVKALRARMNKYLDEAKSNENQNPYGTTKQSPKATTPPGNSKATDIKSQQAKRVNNSSSSGNSSFGNAILNEAHNYAQDKMKEGAINLVGKATGASQAATNFALNTYKPKSQIAKFQQNQRVITGVANALFKKR